MKRVMRFFALLFFAIVGYMVIDELRYDSIKLDKRINIRIGDKFAFNEDFCIRLSEIYFYCRRLAITKYEPVYFYFEKTDGHRFSWQEVAFCVIDGRVIGLEEQGVENLVGLFPSTMMEGYAGRDAFHNSIRKNPASFSHSYRIEIDDSHNSFARGEEGVFLEGANTAKEYRSQYRPLTRLSSMCRNSDFLESKQ